MLTENASDTNEDFFSALALLHSTEEDSAEKLRRMLDSCIEKKYGPGRTLAARMPRRFLQNNDKSSSSARITRKRVCVQKCASKNAISDDPREATSFPAADEETANRPLDDDVKVFEVNYEECCDSENFPRISIPDDGSADGTVCKMCNGTKLGAMILLECQECQETYHPLCHQPPVVDVDVYDPRFVWRCRQCLETPSSGNSSKVKTVEKEAAEEVRKHGDTLRKDVNVRKISGKRNGDLLRKRNDSPRENRSSQLRDSSLFVKDPANNLQKNPSVSQSRKRVGSKLLIARTSIK